MKEQHRQSFLYGTIILAAGTVAVKLIGALFKIPLTNILGGVGMSCFNVAYDLYYPLYAGENAATWFPNGKNSIRVRQTNGAEFIFTYGGKDDWRFETATSFIKGMKGGKG